MKRKLPEQKLIIDRPYKHDRQMTEAIERVGNCPKPVSMSTTIPESAYYRGPK